MATVFPPQPSQGENPYYEKESAWKNAVEQALTAMNSGRIVGDAGKNYRVVAGAFRNTGSGFEAITDAGHRPTGIQRINTTTSGIELVHDFVGTRVVSAVAGCDEALAGHFFAGPSVGLDKSVIQVRRRRTIADYISYDGTKWTSFRGVVGVSGFSNGVLSLTNPTIDAPNGEVMNVHVTGRAGASASYRYALPNTPGIGNTSFAVEIRDNAGQLVTTPDANMRVVVYRGEVVELVNPNTLTTTAWPWSNFWFLGLFEVEG